ncbi:MAG: hypothetical protein E7365_00960 [Clostridiales bacterium]|nr:hypothetical protein [Clostridiales bacterium]
MGSELVSPASPLTFTEQFEAQCPFYLSIGMTYDEYWYGSADRVIYYRKAYKMKQKRNNDLAWLNGRYVYDALKAIVPALRGLSKEPVEQYLDEPYPYTKEDVIEYKNRKMLEKAQKYREYAEARNAERQAREEAMKNGDND